MKKMEKMFHQPLFVALEEGQYGSTSYEFRRTNLIVPLAYGSQRKRSLSVGLCSALKARAVAYAELCYLCAVRRGTHKFVCRNSSLVLLQTPIYQLRSLTERSILSANAVYYSLIFLDFPNLGLLWSRNLLN